MKRQLQTIFAVFVLIILTNACNDGITDYPSLVTEEDNGISLFVPGDNYEFQEGAGLVGVVITSSFQHDGPINVTYKVTDVTAQEGVDYERVTTENTVTIAAQENTTRVLFNILDDDYYSGNKTFEVELVSTNVGKIATAETYYQKTTIVIVDNDCPIDISSFVGSYEADENNGSYGPYTVTIALGPEPLTLLATNIFDVGSTNILYLDACLETVSFKDGEYFFTHSTYGTANIFNTTDYSSTYDSDGNPITLDLYFKACVSAGCFTGFDGSNQRVQLTKQ